MDKLIELASTLVSGAFIAVLAAWLTHRSRNRQEQQAEIGALRVQADAMTVAVMELQSAATTNRLLWGLPSVRGHSCLPCSPSQAGPPAPGLLAAPTS
ncbi:hypothetical protein AB0M57_11310 [Streptomyces sp. NPDC051597]|uniref:hypothetical protein n=1 Tax=Streptomyces sp. NPDC051597 TaxID=3155049 RepID=UPI0034404113